MIPRGKVKLSKIRRDGGMPRAALAVPGLTRLILQIAAAGRQHDIIVANSQKAFVLSALAAPIAKRPLLWWLHDIVSRAHFGWAQICLSVTMANQLCSSVVVPSQAAAAAFATSGGRASLTRVVSNGIVVPDALAERTGLRRALGLPTAFVIGVFSRMAAWKGQHVVMQALTQIPTAHCIIAGGPLFGENKYADALRCSANSLNLSARVHFLGHRNDVPALMRAVDVMVHPSVEPEPFGLTLVEAMLQQTPVIAAAGGAVSEILDGGRLGTIVPPGDAGALAAAVHLVQTETAEAASRAEMARKWAVDQFSVDRMREGIETAIGDVARILVA